MLAKDQIRLIAEEIDRTADARIHDGGPPTDTALWEVVRRASHAIHAVAEMERDDLGRDERRRRARYLVSELETALEAARRVSVALDLSDRDLPSA